MRILRILITAYSLIIGKLFYCYTLIGQIICSTNLYVTCRKEGYIFSLRQTFYYSCYGAMQISLFQCGLTLLIYATKINDHSSDSAAKKTNFYVLTAQMLVMSVSKHFCYHPVFYPNGCCVLLA